MKVRVEKVLSKDLVNELYDELRESPIKIARKGKAEGLVNLMEKFNNKHYPFFEASLKMPSHRSNTYTVEIFTSCRDDIREVI
jgi:hypothetical protein